MIMVIIRNQSIGMGRQARKIIIIIKCFIDQLMGIDGK